MPGGQLCARQCAEKSLRRSCESGEGSLVQRVSRTEGRDRGPGAGPRGPHPTPQLVGGGWAWTPQACLPAGVFLRLRPPLLLMATWEVNRAGSIYPISQMSFAGAVGGLLCFLFLRLGPFGLEWGRLAFP